MAKNKKRAPVVSLTIFFLVLLSSGLSGYYVWQGFLHGFDKYLPILASTLSVGDVSTTIYLHKSLTPEQALKRLVESYKAWCVNRPGGRR